VEKTLASHTQVAAQPRAAAIEGGALAGSVLGGLLAAGSLWWREVVRFYRQRSRVVGVIASPVLFWIVLGSGFGTSFHGQGSRNYLDYFFPGALVMIVLFTAIFAMMSLIEDRKEGFLLSVMVAPVHRSAIVLGKVLGGTTLAAIQGLIFLVFGVALGIHFTLLQVGLLVLTVFLIAFSLTALGFAIAWPMDSTQGFHAVINLFLIPLWLLSGSLFPLTGASGWMRLLIRLNPLTYGVEALRTLLFPASAAPEFPLAMSLSILAAFCAVIFAVAFAAANRRSTRPVA
jgi:ABC-2 type transport system permease protein